MTQHIYSVYGSDIHLMIEESVADAHNRAMDEFFNAQDAFKETHGRPWQPEEPLNILWSDEEQSAYNSIAELINKLIAINGGSLELTEEQMPSNYLIKL